MITIMCISLEPLEFTYTEVVAAECVSNPSLVLNSEMFVFKTDHYHYKGIEFSFPSPRGPATQGMRTQSFLLVECIHSFF